MRISGRGRQPTNGQFKVISGKGTPQATSLQTNFVEDVLIVRRQLQGALEVVASQV